MGFGQKLFKEPFEIKNGYIDVSTKPGLGVEINDETSEALADNSWRKNQYVTYEDDPQADW